MKSPIVKIKGLLKYLPSRDIAIGEKLLEEKDIDSLKELVDSAYFLTQKNQAKEVVPDKYKSVNLEDLRDLKMEVDNYHSLLANIFGYEEYESEIDNAIFENELEEV